MTALAGLVPWAEEGIRQTSRGMVAAAVVPGADGEQAGIFALAAGVGLERDGVEAGDLLQPGLEVAEQGLVAGGLVRRARRGAGRRTRAR